MRRLLRYLPIAALSVGIAAAGAAPAQDTSDEGQDGTAQQAMPMPRPGMGMHRGMGMMQMNGMQGSMGPGMRGMMRMGGMRGMMGSDLSHEGMMIVMFTLMDTDGSETLSLEEVLAPHGRMFARADEDDDGQLTLEEMQAFMKKMHGG